MITHIVGIDEVGRGPIAGPVAVGACSVSADFDFSFCKGIRDSKKLTAQKREEWEKKIVLAQKEGKLSYAVTFVSSRVIDTKGLSYAIKKALATSLKKVVHDPRSTQVLLDGGLKAPLEFTYQKTIIKGDEKEPVISLASIVAKVMRDRHMVKLSKHYLHYDFHIHKGYGTRAHYQKILEHGLSPEHRRSFLKGLKDVEK
ncbi:MAG: ribonuclease ribonuclease [Candidatus Parcubacteria bacterium]